MGPRCFCNALRYTPHRLVKADSNGRILFYAQSGTTREQLAAHGVPVGESQLIVLTDWNLLSESKGTYKTGIPVLGPDKMARLRGLLEAPAKQVAARTATDVAAISASLARSHFADHAFSVVFSYVLDGLVWDRLKAKVAFPSMEITAQHPFWNGAFYAVYPRRANAPGSNGSGQGNFGAEFTWTAETVGPLNRLQQSPDFTAFLGARGKGMDAAGIIETPDGTWRLTDERGRLRVPLIEDRAGDPIHDVGLRIAEQTADRLLDPVTMASVRSIVADSNGEEVIVAAHEFIWSVLDEMLARGELQRPPVLTDGAQTPETLLPLLTLVRQSG